LLVLFRLYNYMKLLNLSKLLNKKIIFLKS